MVKYKNEWKEYSINKDFWKEVLVGRKITDVVFDDEGITSFHLDSGEETFLLKNDHIKSILYINYLKG